MPKKIVIPEITHLQFFVIGFLLVERSGEDIRRFLKTNGIEKEGPGFYQLMARLEKSKLIVGRYESSVIGGQTIRERLYKITDSGRESRNETIHFYQLF